MCTYVIIINILRFTSTHTHTFRFSFTSSLWLTWVVDTLFINIYLLTFFLVFVCVMILSYVYVWDHLCMNMMIWLMISLIYLITYLLTYLLTSLLTYSQTHNLPCMHTYVMIAVIWSGTILLVAFITTTSYCYDQAGDTAMILAAYSGHKDIVEYLVSQGADKDIKNNVSTNLIHAHAPSLMYVCIHRWISYIYVYACVYILLYIHIFMYLCTDTW